MALDSPSLSQNAKAIILNPENDGYLSVVSLWEISMKAVTRKLDIELSPNQLSAFALNSGLQIISLNVEHIQNFSEIPITHRDAFDRLLAGVSMQENLSI